MPDSFLEKRLYSTRNLIYMCQFAKTYPMEILLEMSKVEKQLSSPSVVNVLQLTSEINQFAQEALAQIQATGNQGNINTQESLAQLGEVSETLSSPPLKTIF